MAKLLTKDTGVDILLTELRQEDSGKSTTAKSLPFCPGLYHVEQKLCLVVGLVLNHQAKH